MLITMPVRDWQVIVGKFLAGMALLAAMVGLTLFYRGHRHAGRAARQGAGYRGYLGILLVGGAYMANWRDGVDPHAQSDRRVSSSASPSRFALPVLPPGAFHGLNLHPLQD